MRVVAIVQARMSSGRLPGKVLKRSHGKPLLGYLIERLKRLKSVDELVIATTTKSDDQPIVDFCQTKGVATFRGSEEDVLSRFYDAAIQFHADVIIRLTADCPLVDPAVVDDIVGNFLQAQPMVDYMSNTIARSFSRGFDCEIMTFDVLQEAYQNAKLPLEREHVTPYIYLRFEKFRVANYFSMTGVKTQYRLCVDTSDDFQVIDAILGALYEKNPEFTYQDVLDFMDANPEVAKINAEVEQKKLDE